MRKAKMFLLCGAAVLMMAGCSGKNAETAASETVAEETAAVEETTAAGAATETEAGTEDDVPQGTVVLGEYKGVKYTPMDTTITDEDVEERIQYIVDANPDMVEVDRPAAEGDTVNIDYVGKKDGEAFEGGTAEGDELVLGSGRFIDGFEDGLIGAKKGDTLTLNLTFPEDYGNEELNGQAVTFDVTVNSVMEEQPAELNDEFVQKISADEEITTVDQYRESIRTSMQESIDAQALAQMQNDVLEAVIANCQFSDIDARAEKEFEEEWAIMNNMAAIYGIDIEMYAAMYGASSVDEYKELVKEDVTNGIKLELMMNAVAEAENITLTDADYAELAESNGVDSADVLVEQFGQEAVDQAALQTKVMNFLTDNAVEE